MRIAIIGNMNNNGFSLMRYFRDLGEDAHLFLYLNDGFGSLSHFKPESDTWDIKKWAPFIHSIGFSNTLSSLHGKTILFGLLIRKYFSRTKENNSILHYSPVNYKKLKETLNSFDKIICSGIAPAILYKAGIKTDIYYSYSTGIEFLGNLDVLKSTSHMKKLFIKISRKPILKGLKSSKYILNSDMSVSAQTLEKYKLSFLPLAIPMVYNQEAIAFNQTQKPAFIAIIKAINSADMAIMSPSRNQWIKPKNVKQEAWFESKHNDWLIKGFAKMLILRPACNAKLFLFNYGPDVEASKELIKKLNISKNIIWTDKTSRKEILLMLNYATVCVGEFRTEEKIIWGGTGWEALAAGKLLLQSFNFSNGEFEDIFKYPPPPMLKVNSQESVLRHLLFICDNKNKATEIGDAAKKWFNTYNGTNLTQQWLKLLTDNTSNTDICARLNPHQ